MRKEKKDRLTLIAYSSLAISILSVFTTLVGYTNGSGTHRNFSIWDFLSSDGNGFQSFVAYEYMGQIYVTIGLSMIRILIIIGVLAIVCAVVGLMKISNQKENKVSFALTLIGLVGTMLPSVVLLMCILVWQGSYLGTISCGIYPIVSPIAMIICIRAATQMHRRNQEYLKKLKDAEGLIFRAGNL